MGFVQAGPDGSTTSYLQVLAWVAADRCASRYTGIYVIYFKNNTLKIFIMKRCLTFLLLLISVGAYHSSFSQSSAKPVYVIVHGAWGGSWAFKKVDSLL